MVTSGCEATPASSTAVNVWATLGTGCHLLPSEYNTLSTSIFPPTCSPADLTSGARLKSLTALPFFGGT